VQGSAQTRIKRWLEAAELSRLPPWSPLSIGHSRVHKKEQQQSDHNQDNPHNRPNNQTGDISKGVSSMIAYYEYLRGYAQDYR
jgi:hypothetical protein